MLADWIQQYIKRRIQHNQVEFITGLHDWLNIWKLVIVIVIHHINRLKNENYVILSVNAEKAFRKIHYFSWLKKKKKHSKLGIEGTS